MKWTWKDYFTFDQVLVVRKSYLDCIFVELKEGCQGCSGNALVTVAVPLCLNCTICDSLSSSNPRVINHLTVNKTNKLVITYRVQNVCFFFLISNHYLGLIYLSGMHAESESTCRECYHFTLLVPSIQPRASLLRLNKVPLVFPDFNMRVKHGSFSRVSLYWPRYNLFFKPIHFQLPLFRLRCWNYFLSYGNEINLIYACDSRSKPSHKFLRISLPRVFRFLSRGS